MAYPQVGIVYKAETSRVNNKNYLHLKTLIVSFIEL